jgi:hypothetical protein
MNEAESIRCNPVGCPTLQRASRTLLAISNELVVSYFPQPVNRYVNLGVARALPYNAV